MDPFLGMICAFGFNFNPMGWLYCNGTLIAIQSNSALYALLGTQFGGNGSTNFGIPDLQGRTIIGQGNGAGLTPRSVGQKDGAENTVLTAAQLPNHTHTATFTGTSVTVKASSTAGKTKNPSGRSVVLGSLGTDLLYTDVAPDTNLNVGGSVAGTVTVVAAGNGSSFSNMQPFQVLNYCIATQGIFPTRD
jgi:microcystin-dependent protein